MEYIIAPTLFLNKTCRLPGIGTLAVTSLSAEHDLVNAQIKAPLPSIVFSASQEADENVFNEFTAFSELIKRDIDEKGIVTLKGVGDFIKNGQGAIDFIPRKVNSFFFTHCGCSNRNKTTYRTRITGRQQGNNLYTNDRLF